MNTDLILATLLHNDSDTINKFIFIIPSTKIISEYYCKLFCLKIREPINNNNIKSYITKYIKKNNLIKLLNFPSVAEQYYNFDYSTKQITYNTLFKLNIRHKNLYSIPNGVFELISLTNLYLNNNNIYSIPVEITNLKNLWYLNLSENNLLHIPKNYNAIEIIQNHDIIFQQKFQKISHLVNLKSFPKELCKLVRLSNLDLSSNILLGIPKFINKITDLSVLYLNNNLIDVIWESISNLENLNMILFKNNIIESVY